MSRLLRAGIVTPVTKHTRTIRLHARTTPEVLQVVRRAAEIQGRSLGAFVAAAAEQAARQGIEQTEIILFSVEHHARFTQSLLNLGPLSSTATKATQATKAGTRKRMSPAEQLAAFKDAAPSSGVTTIQSGSKKRCRRSPSQRNEGKLRK